MILQARGTRCRLIALLDVAFFCGLFRELDFDFSATASVLSTARVWPPGLSTWNSASADLGSTRLHPGGPTGGGVNGWLSRSDCFYSYPILAKSSELLIAPLVSLASPDIVPDCGPGVGSRKADLLGCALPVGEK